MLKNDANWKGNNYDSYMSYAHAYIITNMFNIAKLMVT